MIRFGIDLGGTKTEIIALDTAGRELLRRRVATPSTGYDATLEQIAGLVRAGEAQLGARGSVGIGTPGSLRLPACWFLLTLLTLLLDYTCS